MHTLFLPSPLHAPLALTRQLVSYLHKTGCHCLGLYASVQFCHALSSIKKQLEEAGITALTSKPARSHILGQLLGCDNDLASLNLPPASYRRLHSFLYIGDGRFHPHALALSQRDVLPEHFKDIICFDPLSASFTVINVPQIRSVLRRYRSSLMKFWTSRCVGVIITTKPGQEHLNAALKLEKKFPNKKFYYFLDNNISFGQLENFPFIETWINTACPRIGFDDQQQFRAGVINLNDAYMVQKILSSESALMKA